MSCMIIFSLCTYQYCGALQYETFSAGIDISHQLLTSIGLMYTQMWEGRFFLKDVSIRSYNSMVGEKQ